MKKIIKKYIEVYSRYLFYKYIYADFLEAKYVSNFAKYEIEKMENIYETLLFDKAIESRFIYGISYGTLGVDLERALAQQEYQDLENKISNLKNKDKKSSAVLSEIKNYLDKGMLSNIETIVEKCDPFLYPDMDPYNWNLFIRTMRDKEYRWIADQAKYLTLIDSAKVSKNIDVESEISKIEQKINDMYQYYPFNQENLFSSKESINKKISEIKEETQKSKETLKRIANVYLFTNDFTGLNS